MTVTLITGAASGIGRAVANTLHRRGDSLICIDRDTATISTADAWGDRCAIFEVDVTDEDGMRDALRTAEDEMGPIDNAVACAGISGHSDLFSMSLDEFRNIYEVNVVGSLITARTVAASLVAQGRQGSIVLLGSVNSVITPAPLTAYASSKGAVLMLGRSLAIELAEHGIRVNVVGPGPTETPLIAGTLGDPDAVERLTRRIPLRRFAGASEVAAVVEFLTNVASSYVTGAFIPVDGGMLSA